MTPQDGREEIEAEIARLTDEAATAEWSADGRLNTGWGNLDTESAINWLLKREAARCREEIADGGEEVSEIGLRDYFAGQIAAAACVNAQCVTEAQFEELAHVSFRFADVMLRARKESWSEYQSRVAAVHTPPAPDARWRG